MNFITGTQFKRKYFLRHVSLNSVINVPKLDMDTLAPFRDMLIIGNELPLPYITKRTVGHISSNLITKEADYTRISMRDTVLMNLRKEEYGITYVQTQQEFLRQPHTTPIFLDTKGIEQVYKPKLRLGNAVRAKFDYVDTIFKLAVEPYNTSIRTPMLMFPIPESLPNSLNVIERLLKASDKVIEQKVVDKQFLPFLYLLRKLIVEPFDKNSFIHKEDIGLLFYSENHFVIINLFDLIKISKLYPEHKGITKVSDINMIKVILKFILDLNNLEVDDIDKTLSSFTVISTVKTETQIKIPQNIIDKVKDKTSHVPDLEYLYKTVNLTVPKKQITNTRQRVIDMKPETELTKEVDKQFRLPTGTRGQECDTGNLGQAFDVLQARNYHKNIERAIVSLNSSGYETTIVDKIVKKNIAEDYTEYVIKIKPLTGPAIKQRLIVPNVDETSAMIRSGNRHVIRKQKHDAPIRKIKKNRVVLSSHYSKLFITRGEQASASQPAMIKRFIMSKYTNAVPGDFTSYNTKLPYLYEQIGSSIRSFIKDDIMFTFNYTQRETPQVRTILTKRKKQLKDVELNRVVVGTKSPNTLYYVDFNDNLIVDNSKTVSTIGPLKDYLELPPMKPQYLTTKIAGTKLPLIVILMRYYTLEELFVLMDVRPREIKRVSDLNNEWSLKFQDRILAFPNSNIKAMILLSGLTFYKNVGTMPYEAFKDVKIINDILSDAGVSIRVQRELINLYNLFIDPLTLDILNELKQPTTFQGILLYVVELLKDDYVDDVNTIQGFVLKGSNRISGLIYNMLSKQIASNVHNANQRRHSLQMSPYELLKELSADPTIMPEDDINPLSYNKNRENVTILGKFARTPDTVDMKAREFHPTAVGIESEATKESGNTGMDFYRSASPQLTSTTGVLKPIPKKQIDYSNIFSPSAMLALYPEIDDGKRTLFISVQNAHVIPSSNYQVLPVLSGYDYIYPYRAGDKYTLHAKEKGVVKKVSQHSAEIVYKSGSVVYNFRDWYGKPASGKTYVHRMGTNLVVGDTVNPDDCIYYDKGFFGTDIFNRKRVVYKSGALNYVMLTEGQEVFEDSCALSENFANTNKVEKTYVRTITLNLTDDIADSVKTGDKVKYNDTLIQLGYTGGAGLTDKTREVLANIESNSPKAKHIGTVEYVEIYYNDLDEHGKPLPRTDSIDKLIKTVDKVMVRDKGSIGRVDSTFSNEGKPLHEGEIIIIYYITKSQKHLIGSKIIFANQLKATPATTYKTLRTISGVDVDAMFGALSVDARIVPSFKQIISLSTIVKELSDTIISIWDE